LKIKTLCGKLSLFRSSEKDLQLERLSLLGDLVQIEELLQGWSERCAGLLSDETEIRGSWIEGIYIASIQKKIAVVRKC